MNESDQPIGFALQQFEPAAGVFYPIESVAHLTQTPRHLIAVYCLHGVIEPVAPPDQEGWRFDLAAIKTLRRVERLRTVYGMNPESVQLVARLFSEIEDLREELRLLRDDES